MPLTGRGGESSRRDIGREQRDQSTGTSSLPLEVITSYGANSSSSPTERMQTFLARQRGEARTRGIRVFGFSEPALDEQLDQPANPGGAELEAAGSKSYELEQAYKCKEISEEIYNDKKALLKKDVKYLDCYDRGLESASNIENSAVFAFLHQSLDFLKACQEYNQSRKSWEDKITDLTPHSSPDHPGRLDFPIDNDKLTEVTKRWFAFSDSAAGFASTAHEWIRPFVSTIKDWPSNSSELKTFLDTATKQVKGATKQMERTYLRKQLDQTSNSGGAELEKAKDFTIIQTEIEKECERKEISETIKEDKKALLKKDVKYLDCYNIGVESAKNVEEIGGLSALNACRVPSQDFLKACQKYSQSRKQWKDRMNLLQIMDLPPEIREKYENFSEFIKSQLDCPIDNTKFAEATALPRLNIAEQAYRAVGFASVAHEWIRSPSTAIKDWPSDSIKLNKFLNIATKQVNSLIKGIKEHITQLSYEAIELREQQLSQSSNTEETDEKKVSAKILKYDLIEEECERKEISETIKKDKIELLGQDEKYLDYYNRGTKMAEGTTLSTHQIILINASRRFLEACQEYSKAESKHLRGSTSHASQDHPGRFPIADDKLLAVTEGSPVIKRSLTNIWGSPNIELMNRATGLASTAHGWIRQIVPRIKDWPEGKTIDNTFLTDATRQVEQATKDLRQAQQNAESTEQEPLISK